MSGRDRHGHQVNDGQRHLVVPGLGRAHKEGDPQQFAVAHQQVNGGDQVGVDGKAEQLAQGWQQAERRPPPAHPEHLVQSCASQYHWRCSQDDLAHQVGNENDQHVAVEEERPQDDQGGQGGSDPR